MLLLGGKPQLAVRILTGIGVGFIFLAVMVRLPWIVIGIISIIFALGHNLIPSSNLPILLGTFVYPLPQGTPILESLRVAYPLLPWVGAVGCGFFSGKLLYASEISSQLRKNHLLKLGIICLILFLILRISGLYGEPSAFDNNGSLMNSVMSVVNLSKYPPSALYFLMTWSVMFFALYGLENAQGKICNFFIKFGKVPGFYYTFHIVFLGAIYAISHFIFGVETLFIFNLTTVWLMAIGLIIMAIPIVIWYNKAKKKYNFWIFRYL